MFILVVFLFMITIGVEFLSLYSQKRKKALTRYFRDHDFLVHGLISLVLWSLSGIAYGILFWEQAQEVHLWSNMVLQVSGVLVAGVGVVISTIGFLQLGVKRSLHLNFFRDGVKIETKGIYGVVPNPEYTGFWMILAGIALFLCSLEFALLFIEVVVLMIPLMMLENSILKKT